MPFILAGASLRRRLMVHYAASAGGAPDVSNPDIELRAMKRLILAMLKTASGSVGGMLFAVLTTKIMAVMLGPSGVGLLSLLRQTRQTAVTLGSVNCAPALAHGIARRSEAEQSLFTGAVFWALLCTGALTGAVLLIGAPLFASLLGGPEAGVDAVLIRWVAVPVLLGVAQAYLNGILHGHRAVGYYAVVQVALPVVTVALAYPAARLTQAGYAVALVWMMALSAAVGVIVTGYIVVRHGWIQNPVRRLAPSAVVPDLRSFGAFASATLASTMGETSVLLAVRAGIVAHLGLAAAGYFEVAWTLSMTYVMLLLSSFGTYYLPTLSAIAKQEEREEMVGRMWRLSLVVVTMLISALMLLKPWVVRLLYTQEFTPSLAIVRWMLIGDFFKVLGWTIMTPMLAFAHLRRFVCLELTREVLFVGLVFGVLVGGFPLEWIGAAFMLVYMANFALALKFARAQSLIRMNRQFMVAAVGAVGILSMVALLTWSATTVHVGSSAVVAGALVVWLRLVLSDHERTGVGRLVVSVVGRGRSLLRVVPER